MFISILRQSKLRPKFSFISQLSAEAGADTSSPKTHRFHDAVENGNLEEVKIELEKLLKSSSSKSSSAEIVNQGDPGRTNTTPLHLASRRGWLNVLDFLVEKGANVNARGAWELTPLMYAAIFNQSKIASRLITCGADTSLQDVKGKTALDYAVQEKNFEIVEIIKDISP